MSKRLRKEQILADMKTAGMYFIQKQLASVWQEKRGIVVRKNVLIKLKIALDPT